ncbi:hypothetical protein B0T26DRAFT_697030 [Lasiosphaeria miniovina]|uniref:Ubiquitin-like protease family profile domain-containing protein n=1 Tax=Lasiosphaeria miniovina TaxID=1954250 RepID=A0AA40B5N6_9PEZI|nr:uncharacterized protein B0T26DRAFT_697030 [Lasiosphaeria miniovina]KAK0728160.1 hypothetical protein B0T26DRAFT_697030 [Lasiosphaeria miniovina]
MPLPGSASVKSFGLKPVDTINNFIRNTFSSANSASPASSHSPKEPPLAKRVKTSSFTSSRYTVPDDDIVDFGDIKTGSQGSNVRPGSAAGISEYQLVEGFSRDPGRGSRRRRRSAGSESPATQRPIKRYLPSIDVGRDNISDDELGAKPKPIGSTACSALILGDGADPQFLRQRAMPAPHSPQSLNRSKKRPNHAVDGDSDELSAQPSTGPKHKAAMQPLGLSSKKNTRDGVGIPIKGAICYKEFRYVSTSDRRLFLNQKGNELRAFDNDGNLADEFFWLKISHKTSAMLYSPNSNYIKFDQAVDERQGIGRLLCLNLVKKADVQRILEWVAENQKGVKRNEEKESHKLNLTYDKISGDIGNMNSGKPHQPQSRPLGGLRNPEIQEAHGIERPANLSGGAPGGPRKLFPRDRIQLSEQSAPRQDEPSKDVAPLKQRPLRSRQNNDRAASAENRHLSTITQWSEFNKTWADEWKIPLVFHRATVDKDDIPRLDEGECLNDNLIGFGLRYLFDKLASRNEDLNKRVYLHNSFFYEKLRSTKSKINYDGVKSWTAKVDLLSYDYIIVPVNEHYHWWVAIICNPGNLDPSSLKDHIPGANVRNGHNLDEGKGDIRGAGEEATSELETIEAPKGQFSNSPRDSAVAGINQLSIESPLGSDTAAPVTKTADDNSDIVEVPAGEARVESDLVPARGKAKHGRKSSGRQPRKYDFGDPRIITLDSLGSSHFQATASLKHYLVAEFADKRGITITDVPSPLGMKAINIPEQNNLCDCGVYLLGYIQEFVQDPDRFIRTLLQKEVPEWKVNPHELRDTWRKTIFSEQKRYQEEQANDRKKKKPAAKHANAEPQAQTSSKPNEKVPKDNGTTDGPSEVDSGRSVAKSRTASPNLPLEAPAKDTADSHAPQTPEMPRDESVQHAVRKGVTPSQRPLSQHEGSVDEVDLLPLKPDTEVLSIEKPACTKTYRIGSEGEYIEKRFVEKLPSSPPPQREVEEVQPKSFYKDHPIDLTSPEREMARTKPSRSSPVTSKRAARMPSPHVSQTTSPYFSRSGVPVVERAELLRRPAAIDLTKDEIEAGIV